MTDSSLVLVANSQSDSLSTFRLDAGRLERLAVTEGVTGCSTFAVDSGRGLVYAGVKGDPAGILTLSLDRETGQLTPRSRTDLPDGMTYLALTRGGTGLLGASYGGGSGISCPVDGGVVGEPVSRIEFPNLHSVLPSADGRFAYFVSLGADLVAQYALGDDLSLEALSPATVAAPAGSGPRHLVLDAAQTGLYVLTEFTAEVLHFARDPETGTLDLRNSATASDPAEGLARSAFGRDPQADHLIWGADLHFGAGQRTLWCSERSGSTLGAVRVGRDGAVSSPGHFVTTEPQPRGFEISPDGRHLLAAGERSTTVSLYTVDDDRLELVQQVETGAGANWVRFV